MELGILDGEIALELLISAWIAKAEVQGAAHWWGLGCPQFYFSMQQSVGAVTIQVVVLRTRM